MTTSPAAKSRPSSIPTPRSAAGFSDTDADATVCFVAAEGKKPRLISGELPEAARSAIEHWLARPGPFRGRLGEVALLPIGDTPQLWALAGIGATGEAEPWRIGRAAAVGLRLLARHRPRAVAIALTFAPPIAALPSEAVARSVTRGAVEGPYRFDRYRTDAEPISMPILTLVGAAARDPGVRRAAHEGAIEGATLNEVADVANLPGNAAPPAFIAATARRLARETGLSCRIYDAAALRRERCGALLAVAAGSRQEPRVIVLRHPGAGAAQRTRPLVLVGKTLTFDSGGISLKTSAGMEWMRYDKCGGMAVLAALTAAARLQLPIPVIGILAAAENMPDGGATRPGDVIRTRAGKTVEILNTDAEGRLVLADALSLAGDLKPAAVVDLATLTGAAPHCAGHTGRRALLGG
jgi:leucyl aminopeptidase